MYVLDSYALLSFFQGEAGADQVLKILIKAHAGECELSMTAVNLGEIWYTVARTVSEEMADRKVSEIHSMAVEIVDVDWDLTRKAAILKARGGISYADCFAAGLAQALNAVVVTGDPEFRCVEDVVKVLWLL